MAVEYPIAMNAVQAVTSPFGYASKADAATRLAGKHFAAQLPADTPDVDRTSYAAEVRCEHVSAWAPGRWKSRKAVVRRWGGAIDDFWGEAHKLTDGSWRLGIAYFKVRPPTTQRLTAAQHAEIEQRAARPPAPPPDTVQDPLDFGLFAKLVTGLSPDALAPGDFEIPDPLRLGRTLPDE